ncbi:hypothetical protein ACOQNP_24060 [Ectopseudomonas khazarica]|uniref:hypothetical protein n=1 Tax=Ectopseudomonas khazarica TaxID=2502979 RepID=UPI003B95D633
MKERPILFSGPMVRAILSGQKTVTRRVVKPQPDFLGSMTDPTTPFKTLGAGLHGQIVCPYGQPGDRLWVRETFALLGNEDGCCIDWQDNLVKGDERGAARIYRASCPPGDYGLNQIPAKAEWKPDTEPMEYDGAWRPSIHMPRWACRILLEVTAVRVELLQNISEEQALAEGARPEPCDHARQTCSDIGCWGDTAKGAFGFLWESINGAGSWDANPWVWVVEFKRVTP